MGLFDKLKQNFTHGGVDVEIHAPASVSMNDASLPVTVTVTAKDSAQVVNRVRIELMRESNNRAVGESQNSSSISTSLALAENAEVFSIAPGETREVQLTIVMKAGQLAAENLPENNALAGIATALQQLQKVSQAMDQNSYTYYLSASADVEGVTFDPGDRQPIQVLKPGQFGGAINLGS